MAVITRRVTIWPSRATGRSTVFAVARIATCGGVMIAVNAVTSNIPRLDSVNVPSLISARPQLAGPGPRGQVAEARGEIGDAAIAAVEERRGDEPVVERDGDADVDGVPPFQAIPGPDRVERRMLRQGQRDGPQQERRDRDAGLARASARSRPRRPSRSASISISVER